MEQILRITRGIGKLKKDERGVGTVEIVLILCVLIGLVVIFKGSIEKLLNSIFSSITNMTGGVTGG